MASIQEMLAKKLADATAKKKKPAVAPHPAAVIAQANADYFLKLDGIPGESKDSVHAGEIDISTFDHVAHNAGASAKGGGSGAGKVDLGDFLFTKLVDKASPRLFQSCASGTPISSAVLTVRKAGGSQQEYLVYTLTDAVVSSYEHGASGEAAEETVPTEKFALNFSTIKVEYKEQKADGTLSGTTTGSWNLKTGNTSV
jgi:type VI secretion system secreted protein Hcp